MTRIVRSGLAVLAVAALVGAFARREDTAWTGALLVGEPLIAVVAAGGVYLCLTTGHRPRAFAILVGWVLAAVAVRVPRNPTPIMEVEPSFARAIGSCASHLKLPSGGFNLFQWTFDGADTDEVLRAVLAEGADVNVVFGDRLGTISAAIVEGLGGEVHVHEEGATRLLVHTRGVFNLCGADAEWAHGLEDEVGVAVAFVGVREGLIFPIVTARLPHLADDGGYATGRIVSRQRLRGILRAMESSLAVVVADAEAPWTFTGLDVGMRALSMRPVRVPPTWPARVAGVPTPPLHPFDRVWAGPAWRVARSERVRMTTSSRDAVRTRFEPAVITSDP